MISVTCGILKKQKQNKNKKAHRNGTDWIARGKGWSMGQWVKVVKMYKLPVIRQVTLGM